MTKITNLMRKAPLRLRCVIAGLILCLIYPIAILSALVECLKHFKGTESYHQISGSAKLLWKAFKENREM